MLSFIKDEKCKADHGFLFHNQFFEAGHEIFYLFFEKEAGHEVHPMAKPRVREGAIEKVSLQNEKLIRPYNTYYFFVIL